MKIKQKTPHFTKGLRLIFLYNSLIFNVLHLIFQLSSIESAYFSIWIIVQNGHIRALCGKLVQNRHNREQCGYLHPPKHQPTLSPILRGNGILCKYWVGAEMAKAGVGKCDLAQKVPKTRQIID